MQFSVNKRDGPARIGELTIEDKIVTTPNILFVNTSRFKAPDFADILITNKDLKTKKPMIKILESMFSSHQPEDENNLKISNYLFYPKDLPKDVHVSAIKLYKKKKTECYIMPANREIIDTALKNNHASLFVVANASQLLQQQSKFVDFIVEIREKIGYQKMLYLPCVGDPSIFALLTYLGIDLFDSISAIQASRNNFLLFSTGHHSIDEMQELPCSCPSCNKYRGKPSDMKFQQILDHNYYAIHTEIKQVRNAIHLGCLRELVETRIRINPGLTAILRNLDFNHYDFLEKRTPLVRSNQLLATTKESLHRPEIRRFQERIIDRYRKPKSTKILLLLPCSAKKPYSFSKSHKLFREKLYSLKNPHIVHEVIITSPLGIVPRELELIYPASMYDIPVTGVWDEDEKKMIRELLKKYLKNNIYEKTIVHLPTAVTMFLKDILKNPIKTCVDDNPTSEESLKKLLNVLKKTTDTLEKVDARTRNKENLESFASYQFGRETAKKLISDCDIKGKYPELKITYKDRQLGMITQQRGLISLTLYGANRLLEPKNYWVEIYSDFTLLGSVFAPGIKDADESIRIDDEVVVLKNKKLCAVGVALMNGKEMKESTHGEAVKIRHRF
ncbi:MAG: archaeosine synthase subunit alpha [Candidatus Thermoplasmatota archaeon]|nr:archaeosine synthase subunit alpha [Candidatus Thermoplasmatota archaeon]